MSVSGCKSHSLWLALRFLGGLRTFSNARASFSVSIWSSTICSYNRTATELTMGVCRDHRSMRWSSASPDTGVAASRGKRGMYHGMSTFCPTRLKRKDCNKRVGCAAPFALVMDAISPNNNKRRPGTKPSAHTMPIRVDIFVKKTDNISIEEFHR